VIQSRRATPSRAGSLCTGLALSLVAAPPTWAVSFGGDVALTSDYIYRGYSETNDKGALQLDLHASTLSGTFVGVWTSTLDSRFKPRADLEVQSYIGQRFDLSSAWNATVTAAAHSYVGGHQRDSSDYQELTASVSYLDRWTFSLSASPNALRYWGEYRGQFPAGHYPAYDADTSGQWLITKGLFATAGIGYYLLTGNDSEPHSRPSLGYAYGNVGLAYEWRNWRVDVGYFLAQERAQRLLPYPMADHRFAGTLSWRF
jgi:uncharacterized protein (TIGR02001 family)